MARRPRRSSVRRSAGGPEPLVGGRRAYAVDLALDARLFGRIRLLSIDATLDVVEPVGGHLRRSVEPRERDRRTPAGRRHRRATRLGRARPGVNGSSPLRNEVEALLGEAAQRLDPDADGLNH